MKKTSLVLGLISLGWLIYGLFKPVFSQLTGWKEIPESMFNQRFDGIQHPEYLDAIEVSKKQIDSIQLQSSAPSISIASMIKGEMIWNYAVGYQNVGKEIPADTGTLYRIGSTSKALTSLGLGKMIQEDIIHLDSSVQYYTGAFKDKPKITIRQLASHQSGLRNYGSCFCFPIWEYYRNKEFDSIRESVGEFEYDELLFHPDESFAYSSFNYTALSLAIEQVSADGFLDYMKTEVFSSLGMNSTVPDKNSDLLEKRSTPYELYDDLLKTATEVNLSNKWAGGGFLSTSSDLVRAGNVLLDSALLSRTTVETITTPQQLANGFINEQSYALGWRHSTVDSYFNQTRKVEVIHHGGMAVGGLSLLIVYPEYQMVMAININKSGVQGDFRLFDYIRPIAETFIRKLEEND